MSLFTSFIHSCMTKKDLFYRRLSWHSSVISCSSTNDEVRWINNRVFFIKSFKMPNFTNVELTDIVLAYGVVGGKVIQAQVLFPPFTVNKVSALYSYVFSIQFSVTVKFL
jgi:hypothetical protein